MDRAMASALLDLQMHWDDVFDISYDEGAKEWRASRKDYPSHKLVATSAQKLRQLIREDYGRSPVQHESMSL